MADTSRESLFDHRSTSVVPPGTCLIHGSFVGHSCPSCSSLALIPGMNKAAPIPVRMKCPSCPFTNGCAGGVCGWKVENNG